MPSVSDNKVTISQEWNSFLIVQGLVPEFHNTDVRLPTDEWSAYSDKTRMRQGVKITGRYNARRWHHDNHASDLSFDCVLWSNIVPTEIRMSRKHPLISLSPCEAVLFNNDLYEHRQPKMSFADASQRIFIRTSFPITDTIPLT